MSDDFIVKIPLWLRILYLITGTSTLAFAIVVFINVPMDFLDDFLLLGIAILVIAVTRVFNGIFDQRQSKWLRLFNLIIGVLILPLGIIITVGVISNLGYVFVILALVILMIGLLGIVKGFEDKKKVTGYRFFLIFYGFTLLALSVMTLVTDTIFAADSLIFILASALVLIGLRRLIEGVFAHRVLKQPKVD